MKLHTVKVLFLGGVLLATTSLASLAQTKQSLRFLIYDMAKVRGGALDEKTLKIYSPLGEPVDPTIFAEAQKAADEKLQLNTDELLKANLPKDQFDQQRKKLVEDETNRLLAHYNKLEDVSRARIPKASAAASALIDGQTDLMIDSKNTFYGLATITPSSKDVTDDLLKLSGPNSHLVLATPVKPVSVAVGYYSMFRMKDSSAMYKKLLDRNTRLLASSMANINVAGTILVKAEKLGLPKQKIETLTNELKAEVEKIAIENSEALKSAAKELDLDLRIAAQRVAEKNKLDLIVSTDELAGKTELLAGSAFLDVNQQMIAALDDATIVPFSDKSLTGARSKIAVDYLQDAMSNLQKKDGRNASECAVKALNEIGLEGAKTPFGSFTVALAYLAHKQSGNETEAGKILAQGDQYCDKEAWPFPILKYLSKKSSEQELLDSSKTKEQKAQANFCIVLNKAILGSDASSNWQWLSSNLPSTNRYLEVAQSFAH